MRRVFCILTFVLLTLDGCTRIEAPLQRDELVVAVRNTPAFVQEEGGSGFESDLIELFAREQGLPYFYDVIEDENGHWQFDKERGQLKKQYGKNYTGVCHTTLPWKGHTRPGGRLPLNTNGGGLSYMHSGMYGMYALQESIRQLRGVAPAQVPDVKVSVAHGVGNMFAVASTIILSNEMP